CNTSGNGIAGRSLVVGIRPDFDAVAVVFGNQQVVVVVFVQGGSGDVNIVVAIGYAHDIVEKVVGFAAGGIPGFKKIELALAFCRKGHEHEEQGKENKIYNIAFTIGGGQTPLTRFAIAVVRNVFET